MYKKHPSFWDGLVRLLFFVLKQRIVIRNHSRLLVLYLENVLWNLFLVNDEAEHILLEPGLGHYRTALLTVAFSPTVLYLPFLWIAVLVKVNGGKGHGVCRHTLESGDALSFGHWEL